MNVPLKGTRKLLFAILDTLPVSTQILSIIGSCPWKVQTKFKRKKVTGRYTLIGMIARTCEVRRSSIFLRNRAASQYCHTATSIPCFFQYLTKNSGSQEFFFLPKKISHLHNVKIHTCKQANMLIYKFHKLVALRWYGRLRQHYANQKIRNGTQYQITYETTLCVK